jgi:flagellar hook assembly protein FlgD
MNSVDQYTRVNIEYDLEPGSVVNAMIYDSRGRIVRTLLREFQVPGRQSVVWDGTDDAGSAVSSGVYFLRLDSGGKSEGSKMVLVK